MRFGTFKGLRVIEIGAGRGTNALLMAKRGANVTVLDYSKQGIKRSREFFSSSGLCADFLLQDALSLPESLFSEFDIAMSFGLAEHFTGFERTLIIHAHFNLLRKGGMALVSVPNRYNFPYRISKFIAERRGKWAFGEEVPYSRGELRTICHKIGITHLCFLGDSFMASPNLLNYPSRAVKKIFDTAPPRNTYDMRTERGSFLDPYFAYALVLCVEKS